jgi:hypothetical protein
MGMFRGLVHNAVVHCVCEHLGRAMSPVLLPNVSSIRCLVKTRTLLEPLRDVTTVGGVKTGPRVGIVEHAPGVLTLSSLC